MRRLLLAAFLVAGVAAHAAGLRPPPRTMAITGDDLPAALPGAHIHRSAITRGMPTETFAGEPAVPEWLR